MEAGDVVKVVRMTYSTVHPVFNRSLLVGDYVKIEKLNEHDIIYRRELNLFTCPRRFTTINRHATAIGDNWNPLLCRDVKIGDRVKEIGSGHIYTVVDMDQNFFWLDGNMQRRQYQFTHLHIDNVR